MSRMLMISAMFGLAVAASACTQGNPSASLAENQPLVMGDVPAFAGSSIPEPALPPIDFQDSRTYGNNSGT